MLRIPYIKVADHTFSFELTYLTISAFHATVHDDRGFSMAFAIELSAFEQAFLVAWFVSNGAADHKVN